MLSGVKFTDLVSNIDKSFWNGAGSLKVTFTELATIVEQNPGITVGALLEQQAPATFVRTSVEFGFEQKFDLTLGSLDSLVVDVDSAAAAAVDIVSGDQGLKALPDVGSLDVGDELQELIQAGDTPLIILSFAGKVSAGATASTMIGTAVTVGFSIKSGGGAQWFYCRPSLPAESVLDAIGGAFRRARLPQNLPQDATVLGQALALAEAEALFLQYDGFLQLGAQVGVGYEFNGTRNYSLGALDLTTTLKLQAAARISVGYQVGGAFRMSVVKGDSDGWLRMVVQKNHNSSFEFGLGVDVNAEFETPVDGGIETVEAIIGTRAAQVLDKFIELSQLTPDQAKEKLDGFLGAVVDEWIAKGIDAAGEPLEAVLARVRKIQEVLEDPAKYPIELYTKLIDEKLNLDDLLAKLNGLLQDADVEQIRNRLLNDFAPPELRSVIEDLLGESYGAIVTGLDSRIDDFRSKLQKGLDDLDHLINSTAKEEIREFIESKLEALKLSEIAAELAKYDTVEELQEQASGRARELVERLTGKVWDELFADGSEARRIWEQVNEFGKNFENIVGQVGDYVQKALNAKGRFSLSLDYQRASESQRLIDLQIRVALADGSPDPRGIELLEGALGGDFRTVLKDENLERLKLAKATLTDSQQKTVTLKIHVFGWNFKEVSSVLSDLKTSVQVGGQGFMTIYTLSVEGKTVTETNRRLTELNYTLQIVGRLNGAFADDEVGKQAVDPSVLDSLQSRFDYKVKDQNTSLSELTSYLTLGVQLGVIHDGQRRRLIYTLENKVNLEEADGFGPTELRYTVTFDGPSLSKALKHNYAQIERAPNNVKALKQIFVDRLIDTYLIQSNVDVPAIAVLFLQPDFVEDLSKAIQLEILKSKWSKNRRVTVGGTQILVDVSDFDVLWAWVLYNRITDLSKLLERFRLALTDSTQVLTLKELRGLLEKLAGDVKDVGRRDSRLEVLPAIFMEALIEASSGGQEPRNVLMEVVLFNPDKPDEELAYIPLHSTRAAPQPA